MLTALMASAQNVEQHRGWSTRLAIRIESGRRALCATQECPYCGCEFNWAGERGDRDNPTLDRIDNEGEIKPHNIQIICFRCNVTKQDRTHDEFVAYCKRVVDTAFYAEKVG